MYVQGERWKWKKAGCGASACGGDWALHSVGSPVWSVFHSAPSKVFQCRMLHHIPPPHFSAYLYPFKSRDLTNPYAKPSRHTNWLMNNRRKDAARPLRENKRRCTSCVEDFSEMDLDQSSTGSWHSRQKKKEKTKKAQVVVMFDHLTPLIIQDIDRTDNIYTPTTNNIGSWYIS